MATHDQQRFCEPAIVRGALAQWRALSTWNSTFFSSRYGRERATAIGNMQGEADSFAIPIGMYAQHSQEGFPQSWTYLQDEYFIPTHPELREDLEPTPVPLRNSHFDRLPRALRPENAFLLWGTAHSRSFLHIDPFNWTGSNALLVGRKEWKLFPPGQDHKLYPIKGARCGSPLDCYKYESHVDAFSTDRRHQRKYKRFRTAEYQQGMQTVGDLVLIPPGWYHQVKNVEESVAVASQTWSDDAFDVTWQEIVKFPGNVIQSKMPSPEKLEGMSRQEKMNALLAAIPPDAVRKAERQIALTMATIKGGGGRHRRGKQENKHGHGRKVGHLGF